MISFGHTSDGKLLTNWRRVVPGKSAHGGIASADWVCPIEKLKVALRMLLAWRRKPLGRTPSSCGFRPKRQEKNCLYKCRGNAEGNFCPENCTDDLWAGSCMTRRGREGGAGGLAWSGVIHLLVRWGGAGRRTTRGP